MLGSDCFILDNQASRLGKDTFKLRPKGTGPAKTRGHVFQMEWSSPKCVGC